MYRSPDVTPRVIKFLAKFSGESVVTYRSCEVRLHNLLNVPAKFSRIFELESRSRDIKSSELVLTLNIAGKPNRCIADVTAAHVLFIFPLNMARKVNCVLRSRNIM